MTGSARTSDVQLHIGESRAYNFWIPGPREDACPGMTRLNRFDKAGRAKTYFANSFERRVAAATARIMSGCMPSSAISTASAAAVVPPGEVTFWRSVAEG